MYDQRRYGDRQDFLNIPNNRFTQGMRKSLDYIPITPTDIPTSPDNMFRMTSELGTRAIQTRFPSLTDRYSIQRPLKFLSSFSK